VPCANPDGWNAATRVNAHHVDLNRNFPVNWTCIGIAARNAPGPAPASEPETRAMIHLMNLYHPQKVVSLHSPLHCLNWTGPVGQAMASAMARYDHYRTTAQIGYPTPGSLGDYCGACGIGIVTMELPQESEAASWNANRDALLAAIRLRPDTLSTAH
jgi:protein MpaA